MDELNKYEPALLNKIGTHINKNLASQMDSQGFASFIDKALVEFDCGSTEIKSLYDVSDDEEILYKTFSLSRLLEMLPWKFTLINSKTSTQEIKVVIHNNSVEFVDVTNNRVPQGCLMCFQKEDYLILNIANALKWLLENSERVYIPKK